MVLFRCLPSLGAAERKKGLPLCLRLSSTLFSQVPPFFLFRTVVCYKRAHRKRFAAAAAAAAAAASQKCYLSVAPEIIAGKTWRFLQPPLTVIRGKAEREHLWP